MKCFFPVAQRVLAAPLFIVVMVSQQKRVSSSPEVGALAPTERVDLGRISGVGSGHLQCVGRDCC